MPKTKNKIQKPIIAISFFEKKEMAIKKTAHNKKPHKNIWGILIKDSKNIPTIKEIQRQKRILDGVMKL